MFEKEIKQYLERHGFEAFRPKAVLFDMDGVIYDSMGYHAMSWNKSMKKFGLDITPEEAYQFEGMRGVETIKLLAKRQWHKNITDEESAMMYKEKSREFKRCSKAQKMEGVEDLMRKIKADGLKIVVVTGSGQKSLLEKLVNEFDGLVQSNLIISCFDVTHGKPDPEPYLCGLKKAGVEPWEGIVVENAPLGVRAGVAANIFTVAVNTGPLPDKMLADEGANIIFDKMTSFRDSWEKLSENWKNK